MLARIARAIRSAVLLAALLVALPAPASAFQIVGEIVATVHLTGHFLAGGGSLIGPFVPGDPFDLLLTVPGFGGMDDFTAGTGPCDPKFGGGSVSAFSIGYRVEQFPDCTTDVRVSFSFDGGTSFENFIIDPGFDEELGTLLSFVMGESLSISQKFSLIDEFSLITVVQGPPRVVRLEELVLSIVQVPEPSAIGLLAMVLLACGFVAVRQRYTVTR